MSEADAQARAAPSMKLGFVKFVVADLPRMTEFYERALGLAVTQTIDLPDIRENVLARPGDRSGFSLILYYDKAGAKVALGSSHGPLGVYVRDVEAAYAHAVANGAEPYRPPFDSGAMRIAFVRDPEGREIEFVSLRA
jgi:lactoylglutathione lyase